MSGAVPGGSTGRIPTAGTRAGAKGPLREGDFDALGDRLIEQNNLDSAVFVFEKHVELYPGSWNAWDSLGEVLAKAGRKERALEGTRTSLELNPTSKNGRAMLERLEKGQ